MQRLLLVSSLLLSAVLGFASLDKLLNYTLFVKTLSDYPFVSDHVARLLATPIIVLEMAVAVGLLAPPHRRHAAAAAACLFTTFAAIYGFTAFSRLDVTCGCWFMLPAPPNPALHLALNACLASLAVLSAATGSQGRDACHPTPRSHVNASPGFPEIGGNV